MNAFEIGEAVRNARKAKGLTQAALAEQAGVSRHTVMQLESATFSDLGVRKLMNIMSVVGLQLDATPARTRRPTLEEVYELNEQERLERDRRLGRRRPRV